MDNMVNFKEFAWVIGVMCNADLAERLRLLYQLHQPPALLSTDRDELETIKSGNYI